MTDLTSQVNISPSGCTPMYVGLEQAKRLQNAMFVHSPPSDVMLMFATHQDQFSWLTQFRKDEIKHVTQRIVDNMPDHLKGINHGST